MYCRFSTAAAGQSCASSGAIRQLATPLASPQMGSTSYPPQMTPRCASQLPITPSCRLCCITCTRAHRQQAVDGPQPPPLLLSCGIEPVTRSHSLADALPSTFLPAHGLIRRHRLCSAPAAPHCVLALAGPHVVFIDACQCRCAGGTWLLASSCSGWRGTLTTCARQLPTRPARTCGRREGTTTSAAYGMCAASRWGHQLSCVNVGSVPEQ